MSDSNPVNPSRQHRLRTNVHDGVAGNTATSAAETPEAPPAGKMAFVLLMTFLVLEYVRPQSLVPPLAVLRLPLIISVMMVAVWLFKGDKGPLRSPPIMLFAFFIVLTAASMLYAVNHYWVFQNTLLLTSYLLVIVLPMAAFASHPVRFRQFLKVWLVIHFIIAAVAILKGGQGSGGFIQDENDLATVTTAAMPFAYLLAQSRERSRAGRWFCYVTLLVLLGAVVMSGSRGGFVAMMGAAAAIAWQAKQRVKLVLLAGVIGVAGTIMVGQQYIEEMKTITDTNERTASARLYSWRRGWEMFIDNPVFGVGSGNYPWRVAEYEFRSQEFTPNRRSLGGRAAHSLYFTLLPEYGLAGTLVFGALALSLFARLKRARHTIAASPNLADGDLDMATRATGASLVAFFIGATFISVLYYPVFWATVGIVLALEIAIRTQAPVTEPGRAGARAAGQRRRGHIGVGTVATGPSNST